MIVTLTIIRYRRRYIFFALLAMAMHRLPLWLNKKITFYKLLGCGKNGTFDKHPDWQQWAIFSVSTQALNTTDMRSADIIKILYGRFIHRWTSFFNCETWTIFLAPVEGHGQWDGKTPFGILTKHPGLDGPVAVLTRATIRLSKLHAFWQNVPAVANKMEGATGLMGSIGIGEMPFIKQATFSIWESMDAMKRFAYQMQDHKIVIRKTREGNWYSEEMFIRFKPLQTIGTIKGNDPLKGKL